MTVERTFWKSESTVLDRSVLLADAQEQGATPIQTEYKKVIISLENEAHSRGVGYWKILSSFVHGVPDILDRVQIVTQLLTLKRPLTWLKKDIIAMKGVRDALLCYIGQCKRQSAMIRVGR